MRPKAVRGVVTRNRGSYVRPKHRYAVSTFEETQRCTRIPTRRAAAIEMS
jgi:hypothetical protein